ncbi:J domain-containing protein [Sphingobium sp. HBC34]|uniref:J domain-containing protein n=1 Tax=Sphingobium cyanobacteriorum TaxID=3063954 RepID=A0ABT8ZN65_9SPHN|nr:J domain-containing protein [Sphingobium sp. HBC34]MDO7835963.1 J domain-containing protein [Sphingobium sp. HBC34]
MSSDPFSTRRFNRFHGRVEGDRPCAVPGCPEAGEFRAPPEETSRATPSGARQDGPRWRWLCLEHVRQFNQGYNFFTGMTPDEIAAAQRPYAGWERETRAFSTNGASPPPKWSDFQDPLDAIGAKFRERVAKARADAQMRQDGQFLSAEDRKALSVMGLGVDADRKALRTRYTQLLRRYHPDHNGGDRSHEGALQGVIEAYGHLRKAAAFA